MTTNEAPAQKKFRLKTEALADLEKALQRKNPTRILRVRPDGYICTCGYIGWTHGLPCLCADEDRAPTHDDVSGLVAAGRLDAALAMLRAMPDTLRTMNKILRVLARIEERDNARAATPSP